MDTAIFVHKERISSEIYDACLETNKKQSGEEYRGKYVIVRSSGKTLDHQFYEAVAPQRLRSN